MIAFLALIGALAATPGRPRIPIRCPGPPWSYGRSQGDRVTGLAPAFCANEVCSIAHHGYVIVREGTTSIVLHF